MKLRPRPNVLIHLKTTIFKQENDLNRQNNKKNTKKNKIKTAMMKNCTICSVSTPVFFAQRTFLLKIHDMTLIGFHLKRDFARLTPIRESWKKKSKNRELS